MSNKQDLLKNAVDGKAPKYEFEHIVIAGVTLITAALSASVMGYHVWTDAKLEPLARVIAPFFVGFVAFAVSLIPLTLAKPHGEALEGATAQNSLMMVVAGMMIVDGFFQFHAISHIMLIMGMEELQAWKKILIVAMFQLSMFFARGAVIASTTEQQEMLDAHAQRMAAIAAQEEKARLEHEAHQAHLAERRQKYALKVMNGGKA